MDDCIFCRIIAYHARGHILHEDGRVVVFLSLELHPLVVPRQHIPDVYALDDETAGAIMRVAVRVAKAVRAGLGCDGVWLTQANGAAAGQDVFHFHLHVYPRWHGDGVHLSVPAASGDDEAMARRAAVLRAALRAED